jgi:iron complex transport system permease protein
VNSRQIVIATGACAAVALLCALMLPMFGSSAVSYQKAFASISPDQEILFLVRLPRVLLALIAGAGLALAGLLFQSLLRDALATPYTLGVSSGASLGAVAAISFNWHGLGLFTGITLASFVGAIVTLLLVLLIASKAGRISTFTLLLGGVTINSICMAAILFLHSVATYGQSIAITRWLMGGIESVEQSALAWLAILVMGCALYVFRKARYWNLLAIGEEWATTRGVSTRKYLLAGYLISS